MSSTPVDLKKTVNLPQTAFPMKANLPQTEPKRLERWNSGDLYGRIRASRSGRPLYVLHDGPPYANGDIHLGTALNKVLKDFIVKSKTMAGFDAPYIPGWDCHGLPIELKVDQELGAKKLQMTHAQIRRVCRKYAEKWVGIQRKSFVRLGVFGSWSDPYLTMSAAYESVIAGAFVDFLSRGYVYKGLKPVHWCLHDRTALAEAEVEYENHTSPTIWVKFALASPPENIDPALAGRKANGLIWTTTPWTIPANLAIAFHPKFEYAAVEVEGEVYLVAAALLDATALACGWKNPRTLAIVPGGRLEGAIFRHPFLERESIGLLAEYVTLEQGTGAVHTAPGHGQEDYNSGVQYGLPVYCPVDAEGRFFHAEGAAGRLPEELIGKTVWEANPVVIDLLRSHGALCAQAELEHSYPHCWRCHNATIFRATDQWFIGMEKNDLRQHALEAIKQVHWHPAWGEERISNMIAARPDWCISRQRVWGVPIIAFYCEGCQKPYTERAVLDRVVKLFAENTADVWYERTAAELMGEGVACPHCGGTKFRKESDILDVWFDSGSSHLAVLNGANALPWPADMYLEGGDQYRGWFHSSLLIGVGLRGSAPYRACTTHGWTLDEQGRAMSKSLGNGIEPEEIVSQYGADVLRLWVASVDFVEDMRLSPTMLTRLSEAYRKLRNTFRYVLGNLHGFDPSKHAVAGDQLYEIDHWILYRMETLSAQCAAWYEELAFHKIYHALYEFVAADLSAVYFDIIRDRLYTTAPDSPARRAAQTAVWRLGYALVRLLAPILAFTADEVWEFFPKPPDAPESVHMAQFPASGELTAGITEEQVSRLENWEQLMAVRDEVLKNLEAARQEKRIGGALEAHVLLRAPDELYNLLDPYLDELPALFIVSQVSLENGIEGDLQVAIEHASGAKCERCWKYLPDVGAHADFPTLCTPCYEAVQEILANNS
jgi:isoleucyl-tRNA synthetase